MAETKDYSRIGGWLILVGIGVVLSPFRIGFMVMPVYVDLFKSGAFEALTTPGNPAYDPLWAPYIYSEIGIDLALALLWIYLIFLFFGKKQRFPKLYIFALLASLVFIIGDALAIKLVIPNEPAFDDETTKEVLRTAVFAAIWVPYMLISKRVAGTFVH